MNGTRCQVPRTATALDNQLVGESGTSADKWNISGCLPGPNLYSVVETRTSKAITADARRVITDYTKKVVKYRQRKMVFRSRWASGHGVEQVVVLKRQQKVMI